jgi:hypothetical protein
MAEPMSTITRENRLNDRNQTERPLEPLVFKMRPELRRSAVYVSIGFVLIAAVRWGLRDFFPRTEAGPWIPLIILALVALAPLAVLRWRLRLDSSGIARRRLIRWDFWPWDAFEQGKVRDAEAASTTYILPEKPFWARKLSLELLEDADRARVEAIIDQLRVRPALDLPDELALRYGFRKEALIAPAGLLLRNRTEETRYGWNDVRALRIRRHDHLRRDFKSLEIVLPDRVVAFSVHLHNGQLIRSWSATGGCATPTAEVLAAVLERSIAVERVQIVSLSEAPRTVDEWQDRRSMLAKQSRELTNMRRIFWIGGVLMLLIPLSDYRHGIFATVGMTVVSSVALGVFFLVLRYIERDHRDAVANLEAQMPDH